MGRRGQGPPARPRPLKHCLESLAARRSTGVGQDIQEINVCFTSLLDHLDTKSLQQRDMSVSPLSGNVDSKSILI